MPSHAAGGYDFAADPNLPAGRAPVVWLPNLNPSTVVVTAAPETFTDASPIHGLTPVFSRHAADGEHWLVPEGAASLQIMLTNGANAAMPAAVVIPLDGSFAMRTEAAFHMWRVMRGEARGRPANSLTQQQRHRLGLALRGLDGLLAHCTYRTIAQGLFGRTSIPDGAAWKTHDLRDRTIRVCRHGLELMRGGYLNLLRHPRRLRG